MSNSRRISHPMYSMGPFDIIELGPTTLKDHNNFGQFNYRSSVVLEEKTTGKHYNHEILLSGYGSRSTAPIRDRVYILGGRFVKNPEEPKNEADDKAECTGYTFFYDQALTLCIGRTEQYRTKVASLLMSKVGVFGFGVITNRQEVKVDGPNNSVQNDLHVSVKHTDYHTASKEVMEFQANYIVHGNRLLGHTFNLFQVGREALIVGYISGHDDDAEVWQVTVLLVSISAGGQTTTVNLMSTPSASDSGQQPLPNLKRIGARKNSTPANKNPAISFQVGPTPENQKGKQRANSPHSVFPIPSTSSAVHPSPKPDNEDESEEGECSDDDNDDHFTNTYPTNEKNNKRQGGPGPNSPSRSGILAEAQKKLKGRA
ncbi:hypothetical protein PGT21_002113 [Puccinia graminis f. sp. tritici]|uniref:Uncharacterized protein n=2 Tax=Puccinia graminis f. sp. tritici TaxID=56615 RepID=E3JVD1_PUCGT|nr:uncharacterized protein PGTG_01337 [Puccinia graminis f. sp. tritici CRL 75-36-700-3]EFP76006.1 hypothetical protein PGTG_01337 [Puccinia graminis f. sp. tritici CRL 75-36-700-3]KAA1077293.1 hypothetical protein PGT21_002113 [Puccinia graminis f. sp. tritici]